MDEVFVAFWDYRHALAVPLQIFMLLTLLMFYFGRWEEVKAVMKKRRLSLAGMLLATCAAAYFAFSHLPLMWALLAVLIVPYLWLGRAWASLTASVIAIDTDLSGQNAIVTGANCGIGYETALQLALHNAFVVLACRSEERGSEAEEQIKRELLRHRKKGCTGDVKFMHCDLSSLASVRDFAAAWEKAYGAAGLSVLVNNAGMSPTKAKTTGDGFELGFQVNHLGHFLLTNLLLDAMKRVDEARVVNVASVAHKVFIENYKADVMASVSTDLYAEHIGEGLLSYSRAKFCNVVFTVELERRLAEEGIDSIHTNAVHPGGVRTNVWRALPTEARPLFYAMAHFALRSNIDGAATSVYLALSPEVRGCGGRYYIDCEDIAARKEARDGDVGKALWEASHEAVKGFLIPVPEMPLPPTPKMSVDRASKLGLMETFPDGAKRIVEYAWYQKPTKVFIHVTQYMDGVHELDSDAVTCRFGVGGFDLRVNGLHGNDFRLYQGTLYAPTIADKGRFKVKKNKVVIILRKKEDVAWHKLSAYIPREDKKDMPMATDPEAAMMNMLKECWDEGDAETRKWVTEAWEEQKAIREGRWKPPDVKIMDFEVEGEYPDDDDDDDDSYYRPSTVEELDDDE
eukprot:PLAT11032.1.p1 GENE.PLAT11032.1~~PLAT11032.1.p1  ORF type:complete len:636 (-),score=238.71 PLAT11032.1:80-1960(-)